jgi:hypothetical protein
MPMNRVSDKMRLRRLEAQELSCSWCGYGVPLPAGEFSGVCIDCGTVMFREPLITDGASERNHVWGTGNPFIPAPAG